MIRVTLCVHRPGTLAEDRFGKALTKFVRIGIGYRLWTAVNLHAEERPFDGREKGHLLILLVAAIVKTTPILIQLY